MKNFILLALLTNFFYLHANCESTRTECMNKAESSFYTKHKIPASKRQSLKCNRDDRGTGIPTGLSHTKTQLYKECIKCNAAAWTCEYNQD